MEYYKRAEVLWEVKSKFDDWKYKPFPDFFAEMVFTQLSAVTNLIDRYPRDQTPVEQERARMNRELLDKIGKELRRAEANVDPRLGAESTVERRAACITAIPAMQNFLWNECSRDLRLLFPSE